MLAKPVLLYDAGCGFCRRWVRRLERWDRHDRIMCLPAGERDQVSGLPPISNDALERAMHFVSPDGRLHPGGQALPAMLPYLPGGRWLRPLFVIPGVQPLTNRMYGWIAARRHGLGPASPQCDPVDARPPGAIASTRREPSDGSRRDDP